MRSRVGVVIPYFGTFPSYAELTVKSMVRNSTYDFIFFTDQALAPGPNIVVHKCTLDYVRSRIHNRIGSAYRLEHPYKLCDYRPAFGQIFAEELAPYSHWGHADMDVIFGDVEALVPTSVLADFDKVLIRGNFALYRNSALMNSLYRTVVDQADYRAAFSTDRACYFDEWQGIAKIVEATGVSLWDQMPIFDISANRFRLRANALGPEPRRYYWSEGTLHSDDKVGVNRLEAGLIHLQKRAMRPPSCAVLNSNHYEIRPNGFRGVRQKNPAAVALNEGVDALRFHGRRAVGRIQNTFAGTRAS